MSNRAAALLGAAAFGLLAALALPALAHPGGVYGPGSDPCATHELRDAMFYALLAAFTVASALAGWMLLTRGRPVWLAGAGVGLLVVGVATSGSSSFGCLRDELALAPESGRPWLPVVLAAMTTTAVVLLWLRWVRRGEQATS